MSISRGMQDLIMELAISSLVNTKHYIALIRLLYSVKLSIKLPTYLNKETTTLMGVLEGLDDAIPFLDLQLVMYFSQLRWI